MTYSALIGATPFRLSDDLDGSSAVLSFLEAGPSSKSEPLEAPLGTSTAGGDAGRLVGSPVFPLLAGESVEFMTVRLG